jgi:hypothetical protein
MAHVSDEKTACRGGARSCCSKAQQVGFAFLVGIPCLLFAETAALRWAWYPLLEPSVLELFVSRRRLIESTKAGFLGGFLGKIPCVDRRLLAKTWLECPSDRRLLSLRGPSCGRLRDNDPGGCAGAAFGQRRQILQRLLEASFLSSGFGDRLSPDSFNRS